MLRMGQAANKNAESENLLNHQQLNLKIRCLDLPAGFKSENGYLLKKS